MIIGFVQHDALTDSPSNLMFGVLESFLRNSSHLEGYLIQVEPHWKRNSRVSMQSHFRHDKRRSPSSSGARLPDAGPPGVLPRPVRHHAGVLAQGPHEETNLWNSSVEAGRLLHDVWFWVQRSLRVLTVIRVSGELSLLRHDTAPPKFHLITKVSKIRFHSHRPDPFKTHQVTNISAFEPQNHAQHSQTKAAFFKTTVNLLKNGHFWQIVSFWWKPRNIGILEIRKS